MAFHQISSYLITINQNLDTHVVSAKQTTLRGNASRNIVQKPIHILEDFCNKLVLESDEFFLLVMQPFQNESFIRLPRKYVFSMSLRFVI